MGVVEVATEGSVDMPTASVNAVLDVLLEREECLRTLVVHHSECEDDQVQALLKIRAKQLSKFQCDFADQFPLPSISSVAAVHREGYLSWAQTSLSTAWTKSMRAAGSICYAVDNVMSGLHRNAFCCVRPAGGNVSSEVSVDSPPQDNTSLFNHAAIGAMHALNMHSAVKRVAIVDLDVTPCKGTEEFVKRELRLHGGGEHLFLFSMYIDADTDADHPARARENLFYNILSEALVSGTSQTSAKKERAVKKETPKETTVQSVKDEFKRVVSYRLVPCLRAYTPDLVILLSGFAGAKVPGGAKSSEPEENSLDQSDYFWATKQVMEVASVCCEGKLVSILENGCSTDPGHDDSAVVAQDSAKYFISHINALCGY